jgi:hypothetical protein
VRMVGPDSPLLSWYGFPTAFLLTCAIEVPAYLAAFWLLGWCRSRPSAYRPLTIRSALTLAFLLNLISHPLLWLAALRYDSTGQRIVAETCVAFLEGMLIFAVVSRRPGTESRISRVVAADSNRRQHVGASDRFDHDAGHDQPVRLTGRRAGVSHASAA